MKKNPFIAIAVVVFLLSSLVPGVALAPAVLADWAPGDGHKMHFPQLPGGWDVDANYPLVLADDFRCTETGFIKDIHFWGSWKDGVVGEITSFVLSIHADIPAAQNPDGYSKPGNTLWELEIFDWQTVFIEGEPQGWYDPSTGYADWDNHSNYFQYNVFLSEEDWFRQVAGTIYWLNISAVVADPGGTRWGWKSSDDNWMDDAVWAHRDGLAWLDMHKPEDWTGDNFLIEVKPGGVLESGGGSGYESGTWYYYENTDWWNQWYYNQPFDLNRDKLIHIEFDVFRYNHPSDVWFELAVNWATDEWQREGPPPVPPLTPEDEEKYISRAVLVETDQITPGPPPEGGQHYVLDYVIRDYNPEWVSIDVRGYNFIIPHQPTDEPGIIEHVCVESLDLAFVITGEPEHPVGGTAIPVNKVMVLAPLLGLAAVVTVISVVAIRRRRTA